MTSHSINDLNFNVDRSDFFRVGRALQRGIGKTLLGTVKMEIRDGSLTISSQWGGAQMRCQGAGEVAVEIRAKAFCSLITTRYREPAPSGSMKLIFRPQTREVAIDRAGVKAKFTR